jgi:hypothetical protein
MCKRISSINIRIFIRFQKTLKFSNSDHHIPNKNHGHPFASWKRWYCSSDIPRVGVRKAGISFIFLLDFYFNRAQHIYTASTSTAFYWSFVYIISKHHHMVSSDERCSAFLSRRMSCFDEWCYKTSVTGYYVAYTSITAYYRHAWLLYGQARNLQPSFQYYQ